jgi:hypothetical protein
MQHIQQNGLNREGTKNALRKFLKSSENRVFVLKGNWGVGKTHVVKEVLGSNNDFCYASLFGTSSIEDLRSKLCLGKLQQEINNSSNQQLSNIVKSLFSLFKSRQGQATISAIEAVSILGLRVYFSIALKNKIVCIDDIERKSQGLDLDAILGFVEEVVEQQDCKVILIFCETQLDENSQEILEEYREKVIDVEVSFNPGLIENFYLVFQEKHGFESILFKYLSELGFQINNIRVLRKCEFYVSEFESHLSEDILPTLKSDIIAGIAFITLAKFDRTFPIKIKEVKNIEISADKDSVESLKMNADLRFRASRLGYLSEVSQEIIGCIETSIFNVENFKVIVKELNDREKRSGIKEKFHQAWEAYSRSFESSGIQLKNDLSSFLEDFCESLSISDFNQIKDISEVLNLDIKEYEKRWLRACIDDESLYKSRHLDSLREIVKSYPDLSRELEERLLSMNAHMDITKVLAYALETSSFSKQQLDYLNTRNINEWLEWLKQPHQDKYLMIRKAQDIGGTCSQMIDSAIKDLAKESDLNAFRAKNLYEIDINSSTTL